MRVLPPLSLTLFLALVACDERPPRSARATTREQEPDANVFGAEQGTWVVPRDPDPTVALGEPTDIGSSVCIGMRVLRVERRRGTGTAPLAPRFYGRDEHGRIVPFDAILRCELRQNEWLTKPRAEGTNLILWRGPTIFEPDGDCDWREPVTTSRMPSGARRLTLREHCRHRVGPGPADRTVTVELSPDYSAIVER